MAVLIGAGVVVGSLALLAGYAVLVAWCWPVFLIVGFAAMFVGLFGMLGEMILHGGDSTPTWMVACIVTGLVLCGSAVVCGNHDD